MISAEMICRRPAGAAPVVRAAAEHLPISSGSFDAAMASLTLHHWVDRAHGLRELRRVARRQVVFMFDPRLIYDFWAIAYWPTSMMLPSEQDLPTPEQLGDILDVVEIQSVVIPHDCTDGFGAAFWARPEAYLDPAVQQGTSWLAQLSSAELAEGSERLADDLRSGEWDRRLGHLRSEPAADLGYRLVIAENG